MTSMTENYSLFEIDTELDDILEQIEEQVETEGEPSEELLLRFREFCAAHGEKGLKGFRRIFSRFEKLDVLFLGFLNFAFINETLRYCEHALVWG